MYLSWLAILSCEVLASFWNSYSSVRLFLNLKNRFTWMLMRTENLAFYEKPNIYLWATSLSGDMRSHDRLLEEISSWSSLDELELDKSKNVFNLRGLGEFWCGNRDLGDLWSGKLFVPKWDFFEFWEDDSEAVWRGFLKGLSETSCAGLFDLSLECSDDPVDNESFVSIFDSSIEPSGCSKFSKSN